MLQVAAAIVPTTTEGETAIKKLAPYAVAALLRDDEEIAFIDVREHGQYGEAHPLRVVSVPYSVLEGMIAGFVPRLSTRTVLLDDGDGVAERAAGRLAALGYTDVAMLDGGMPAWDSAGLEVYKGVNVPCKAFGEVVEHAFGTPAIDPSELKQMIDDEVELVIVDGRTPEEFKRMSIPGGMSVPNAEMIYRISDIAPNPDTTVVVNCAGRTRSIIGAQTLLNARIPNRVVALRGGTMAWRLSGYELDHGADQGAPDLTPAGLEAGRRYAQDMRKRYNVPSVDLATLAQWQADSTRTTYVLDIRSQAEYEAGHLAGARHAPGGQLVQGSDQWCAVWGARMVLVDGGSGVRTTTTAHWMVQMDWDVHVLTGDPLVGDVRAACSETGPAPRSAVNLDGSGVELISKDAAEKVMAAGNAYLLDVDVSTSYRERRLLGALWGIRPRVVEQMQAMAPRDCIIVYGEHEMRARLAAIDLAERVQSKVYVLAGGREGWCNQGGATEASAGEPVDSDCLDYLFFVHDRHAGNDDAARAYLAWEENLPAQLEAEGENRFPLVLT